MEKFRKEVEKALKKALGISAKISLEQPPDKSMGDYAFPCFSVSKELKKDPKSIAEETAVRITLNKFIRKVEVKGPYINFFLNKQEIAKIALTDIEKRKDRYGMSEKSSEKKVMVEFCSPNANKPLHLGHLRNIMIGECVSRLFESAGNSVIRANLVNDRGVHICKSMYAYQKWGKGKEPDKKPDHFVGDFYVLFAKKSEESEMFEKDAAEMLGKWENGDNETIRLWEKMRSWTLQGFESTYSDLGILFDKTYFESDIWQYGKNIVMEGLKKNIFRKGEKGEVLVDLEKYGLPNKVLLRSDGSTIYMTQDLYLAQLKFEDFNLDKSVYVVALEQDNHFRQLFRILELIKFKGWKKCHHLSYGMVHLPEGRMKSREGNVVDADDLIMEMKNLAGKEIKKRHKDLSKDEISSRSEEIGIGALKFYMLKTDHLRDITYNPEESVSFEGETGPYVQYAHARCCSLLRKSPLKEIRSVDFALLRHPKEEAIISSLAVFPETVKEASESMKPALIPRYLIELSHMFSEFYENCPIIQEDEALMKARLLIADCTRQVLRNGLYLMGIKAPEKM